MNSTVTRRVAGVVLGEALEVGTARAGREAAMQAAPRAAATFERGGLRGATGAPGAPGVPGALPSAITNPMNVIGYSTPARAAMSAEHRVASEAVENLTTRLGRASAADRPWLQGQLDTATQTLRVHETRAAVEHMTHVIRHTPAAQPERVIRSLYQRLAQGQAQHADALTRAGASEADIIAAHHAAGHSFARAARTDLQSVGRAWTEDMGSALRHFAAAGDHRSVSEMFR
ncbi:MAG TPA: hypothetical protein VLC93_18065, partial [Myxococcota bacterium]|nr:hypothetical protein [Myxococcota bacterium]